MKKILLSLMFICSFVIVKAQIVALNEVYGNPGSGNSEFIELYNSSVPGTLDCYTILVYFENEPSNNKGWYVLNLPSTPIIGGPQGFYVLAPSSPFNVQGTAGAVANLSWNDPTFRGGGTDGYLKKYLYVSGSNAAATYTEDLGFLTTTPVTNLLDGTLSGGQFYFVLLYKNGVLTNGFIGGGSTGDLTTYNIPLGTLTVAPSPGSCGASFNAFGNIHPVEFWNPSGGSDNGYARTSDGLCGSWIKTSSQVNHTPGRTNGSAAGVAGSFVTAEMVNCPDQDLITPGVQRTITASIQSISGSVTIADDFPVNGEVYYDANANGLFDDPGPFATLTFANIFSVDGAKTTGAVPDVNGVYFIAYRTKRGCFDQVIKVTSSCATLPINLKSFTAARNHSNVGLKWETALEENNKGFEIQRKIGAGGWVLAWTKY